jgi:hypothetical protein
MTQAMYAHMNNKTIKREDFCGNAILLCFHCSGHYTNLYTIEQYETIHIHGVQHQLPDLILRYTYVRWKHLGKPGTQDFPV